MDDLATVWCGWAEMELRHDEFDKALQAMQRAASEPAASIQRRRMQASQSRDEKRKAIAEVSNTLLEEHHSHDQGLNDHVEREGRTGMTRHKGCGREIFDKD